MRTRSRARSITASASALAGLLLRPALAAPSPAPPLLDEVIVTAQRHAENLYEVPLSVAVVTGEALQAAGARDLSAIAGFAPNVSFDSIVTQTGGSTATSVYIRGIGQSDVLQTTDPGVGLFVDGVYIARSVGSLLDVADVERIEVLRGPQGTLYGRNTIGGAINVITRAPGDEFALSMRATLGSDDRFDAFLRIDAPFSESVRSKLAVASFDQNGYSSRPNVGDRLGNKHSRAAHGQLVFSPNDTFKLSLSADYTRANEDSVAVSLKNVVQICPAGVPAAIGGCDANAAAGALPSQTFLFNNVPPINFAAGGLGTGTSIYDERFVPSGNFINLGTAPEGSELELWGASVTLDWTSPAFTVRSISAWRTFDAFFARDTDVSPFDILAPSSQVDQRQFSEELQIRGTNRGDRLEWLAGVYYLDERADDDSKFRTASFEVQSGGRDIINRSAAAFGQATLAVADAVAVTAGVRYTDEHKSYLPTTFIIQSVTGMPPAGLVLAPPLKNELDFAKTTYRTAVELTPVAHTLIYVSYSTGFKSGGFVQRNAVPRQQLLTFAPETVQVLEVGAKATVLDGRLRASAAVFDSDYQDLHIRVIEPLSLAPITSNAGDASIRGAEFEFEAAPHARLRLLGGIGYLHGRYDEIAPAAEGLTLDSRLTDSPEWSANLSAIASASLGSTEVSGRLDWTYRSSNFNDAENTPELEQDALHLLTASATWRCTTCRDRAWYTTLGVRNMTDEEYVVSGFASPAQGPITVSCARPREWFLTIGVDW